MVGFLAGLSNFWHQTNHQFAQLKPQLCSVIFFGFVFFITFMAGVCLSIKSFLVFSIHFHLLQTWHFFPHSAGVFADEVRVFEQIKSVNRFCPTNER